MLGSTMDSRSLLQAQAYDYVKKQILSNKLEANVLHSETKLAAELGISRTPLRQSLHCLSQDGYITIFPSKGFMIRQLTDKDMRETIEVRCAIEGFCTHAIAHAPEGGKRTEFLQNARQWLQGMEQARRMEDKNETFMELDHKLHMAIVKFVNNPEFNQIFQRLMYLIHLTSSNSLSVPGRIDSTIAEHEAYVQALEERDGNSAYQMLMTHLMMPLNLLAKGKNG